MTQIEAVLKNIIFHNAENGYTVAVFQTEAEELTAVGSLPACHEGSTYLLRGEMKVHPRFGEQFAFKEAEEEMPSTGAGIEAFLSSGVLKGIGKKTAKAIVDKFGEDTFRIIEEEPDMLTRVSGIGEKKARAVAEAFQEHREFAETALKLQQYGIDGGYALRLYKVYGSETVDRLKENPYGLIDDFFGIGFRKADRIAEKIGIEKDDPFRIMSGVRFTLAYHAGEGSTFMPEKLLCERAAELLDISSDQVREELVQMAFEGDIFIEEMEGRNVVYLFNYYNAEQNVCRCLKALSEAEPKMIGSDVEGLISMTENETGIKLSDEQKDAVRSSLDKGVSVITGGPGTGKTTIINTIMNIFEYSGLKAAIAAPTGRAAKRITETSGKDASTIHRLLEYSYFEGEDNLRFGKNSENPLDMDVVIIDEASMVDLILMNALVSALKPGTRLIMVGDADQLPPVGAGAVLRDMIESEYIYAVKLTEIFRQAKESLIVVNAHRINKGEYPDCNEKGKDFFLIREHKEAEMLNIIKDLYIKRLPSYYTDTVPERDIQVLTPTRKGNLGSLSLNRELQQALNPPGPGIEEKTFGDQLFRQGEKVMQIKNNYQMEWKNHEDFSEGEGIFNGDIGFIMSINKEYNEMTVLFDGCRYVKYDFSQLDELELAYAVTVHKSQGSEFPIVIMPVSWFPPLLATRNLFYTAVTRGKSAVVLVGSEQRMHDMVDNNTTRERFSGLKVRLGRFLSGDSALGQEAFSDPDEDMFSGDEWFPDEEDL